MTDHVARMVQGWCHQSLGHRVEPEAVASLVASIHRLIGEAEEATRRRCEKAIAGRRPARAGENLVLQAIAALEHQGTLPG